MRDLAAKDGLLDKLGAVETRIAETPAHGLDGVAVKLRLLRYDICVIDDPSIFSGALIKTALGAVERLAGKAG